MIRHASVKARFGAAFAILALAVAMIGAPFLAFLVAAVGAAEL